MVVLDSIWFDASRLPEDVKQETARFIASSDGPRCRDTAGNLTLEEIYFKWVGRVILQD